MDIRKKLDDFVAWFRSSGGYIHQDVEFAFNNDHGVFARVVAGDTAIAPHTLVLKCPHRLSLSALNAHDTFAEFPSRDLSKFPSDLLDNARPQFVAALFLIVQRQQMHKSTWSRYLDVLPNLPRDDGLAPSSDEYGLGMIDPPYHWLEQTEWLRGTQLETAIVELRNMWISDWERWQPVVQSWGRDACISIDFQDVMWGLTMLGSRAFSSSALKYVTNDETVYGGSSHRPVLDRLDPHMLLYPGLDSLNHNPSTQNRWTFDNIGFGLVCNDGTKSGEQIWNPYGAKSNGQLLLSFGFCLQNNPHDYFSLKVTSQPSPVAELLATANRQIPDVAVEATPSVLVQDCAKPGQAQVLRYAPDHMIPASSDSANRIFFVRLPALITDLNGYADATSTSGVSESFAGFPIELLNVLVKPLANRREFVRIGANPQDYSSKHIWVQLCGRAQIEVTLLLLRRLRVELVRLQRPALPASLEADSMCGRAAIIQARLNCAKMYRLGQAQILEANVKLLRNRVDEILISSHPIPSLSSIKMLNCTQDGVRPALMTLGSAMMFLRNIICEADMLDFIVGLEAAFGTLDFEDWRKNGFEDEIWSLWLVLVITMVRNTTFPSSTSPHAPELLAASLDIWRSKVVQCYENYIDDDPELANPDTATDFASHEYRIDNQDTGDEQDSADEHAPTELGRIVDTRCRHANSGQVWSMSRWPHGLIRVCERIMRNESVVLDLDRHEYTELYRQDCCDRSILAGSDTPLADYKCLTITQDFMPVVAMYLEFS